MAETHREFWYQIAGQGKKSRDLEVHKQVMAEMQSLREDIAGRSQRWYSYLSKFRNENVYSWMPGSKPEEDLSLFAPGTDDRTLYLNPLASGIATLASRIASQRIAPTFLTSTNRQNRYKLRQTAKKMNKAVLGEWSRAKLDRLAVRAFLDAAVMGLGAIKVSNKDGRLLFERVFPAEIIVDERAYRTVEPRTLYQQKWCPADVLATAFPKYKSQINMAVNKSVATSDANPGMMVVTDLVEVIESWHLPSGPDAKDGWRCVVVDGATLECEQWTRPRFPFAFLKWSEPHLGFYPIGAMQESLPAQDQMNKMLGRVQENLHLHAQAKTFVEKGSVNLNALSNAPGSIVEVNPGAMAPQTVMPQAVSSEVYKFVWELYQKIFEGMGVSMLSAASVKPAGIESGIALRYLAETETGRHQLLSQAWEKFHLDVAELTVEECKALKNTSRYYDGKNGYEEIDWKEIDLDRDAYELQVFPTSYLPHTPAGRLQTIQEMIDGGFISQARAVKLLGFPDLENYESTTTASIDDVERQITAMLEGEPQTPLKYMDLAETMPMVVSAVFRAREDGVPEENIKLLFNWLDAAEMILGEEEEKQQALIQVQQMEQQMAAQPPGPAPAEAGPPME